MKLLALLETHLVCFTCGRVEIVHLDPQDALTMSWRDPPGWVRFLSRGIVEDHPLATCEGACDEALMARVNANGGVLCTAPN